MTKRHHRGIGNVVAPPRFLLFLAVTLVAGWLAIPPLGLRFGLMTGFDIGALTFLVAIAPLFRQEAEGMRQSAKRNDGNRFLLLVITGLVSLVILAAVASELMEKERTQSWALALIVGTLALCWTFSNMIYALHYAHLFYSEKAEGGGDSGGLTFPETPDPDYWDFVYFSFCLGMTFQTSDMNITSRRIRRVVTVHCLAAFVFNLGIIAFSINVLGGGQGEGPDRASTPAARPPGNSASIQIGPLSTFARQLRAQITSFLRARVGFSIFP